MAGYESRNANHTLAVACHGSYHNREVISGTYQAKGVFAGRLIYEKTVQDYNGMWWSMRWDAQNNRWEFNWGGQKVRGTIENVRGESTV